MRSRQFSTIALFVALLGFAAASRAEAQVSIAATEATVVVQNGLAEATFRLEVTNGGSSALSNVTVAMPDGTSSWVGAVAAASSVKGGAESHVFDVSGIPATHNTPISVTLKFSIDGAEVEQPALLVLRTQE